MSIRLLTQQDIRPLRRLPFCYVCSQALSTTESDSKKRRNDDHVPPSSVFLAPDRNFPLILPTHYECNHDRHVDDQMIGQLVNLLHGKAPNPQYQRIELLAGAASDGGPIVAASGFDFRAIIRRWVCGFHTALYREPLVDHKNFMTFVPLAESNRHTGRIDDVPHVIPHFVRTIRENRAVGALDRIVCRNGKCVYECVWVQDDDGGWFCCYALDLYGWSRLGDTDRFGTRGCVGSYIQPGNDVPPGATRGARPSDRELQEPLDPFATD